MNVKSKTAVQNEKRSNTIKATQVGFDLDRRHFLTAPAIAAVGIASGAQQSAAAASRPMNVAAVVTEYRWYSHADVVCGRLLGGYSANGKWTPPRTKLVSLHCAQTPQNDMSRDMSARYGFTIYPTIREALTLGQKKLAVDAVCFIGEHGDYPTNDAGQKLYPRFELFSEVLDVYEASGRGVPTFFDKHFSYDWSLAKKMFERARKIGFPLIAGSSVPLAVRKPDIQPRLDTPMSEAACVGYGPLDAYGFHLLEVMQCLVERRKGGETGVREVETIEGDAIWAWLDGEGGWAKPLLQKAYEAQASSQAMRDRAKTPVLFRIVYNDNFRAAALMLSPSGNDRSVAIRVPGQAEPMATMIGVETKRPLPHFDGLVRCIEETYITGKELYPPERTLLTTGILSFAFESRRRGAPVSTPELSVTYRAPDKVFYQTA